LKIDDRKLIAESKTIEEFGDRYWGSEPSSKIRSINLLGDLISTPSTWLALFTWEGGFPSQKKEDCKSLKEQSIWQNHNPPIQH